MLHGLGETRGLPVRDLYFENTTISFVIGPLDACPAEALCFGVNAEGIMASGHAGIVRLAAGPEVERDLRAQSPLLIGDAYLTGVGRLADRGVTRLVCIVASERPGAPVQRAALERGLDQALELLDREKVRTLAIPDLGLRIPNMTVDGAAALLAHELARRLRRGAALRQVIVASLDPAYLRAVHARMLAHGATPA